MQKNSLYFSASSESMTFSRSLYFVGCFHFITGRLNMPAGFLYFAAAVGTINMPPSRVGWRRVTGGRSWRSALGAQLTGCLFCLCPQAFLRDLLKEAKKSTEVSEDKLIEYTDTMVSGATATRETFIFLFARAWDPKHEAYPAWLKKYCKVEHLGGTVLFTARAGTNFCSVKCIGSCGFKFGFDPAFVSVLQLQVFDSNKDGKLQLSEMAK